MKHFFGYIRVSTAKQGTHGVSLTEQRDAIAQYARRNDLTIARWFEERETAAKAGRPVFTTMLGLLRNGNAAGVVIHKVDRSSRNFRDWADIGDLVDAGIDVRFATEALDLQSRGGRIAADVLAVVAADYIRNLREETKKGMRGRLKQGLYPMPAPIGYQDCGGGSPKSIDPVAGPLVRTGFELYATGRYSITTLQDELHSRGLRTRRGGTLSRTAIAGMLHNPFYTGLVQVRTTGETFLGVHEPLISKTLFDTVQAILAGKAVPKIQRHDFLFRRMLTCRCGSTLTGERQKGHVYYRCHIKNCSTTGIREEDVDRGVRSVLAPLVLTGEERACAEGTIAELEQDWILGSERRRQELEMRIGRISDRLGRLTDAFIDGSLEKHLFEERKHALLEERVGLQNQITRNEETDLASTVREFFELAFSANVRYETGNVAEKRETLRMLTSNRTVDRKLVDITLREPFDLFAERSKSSNGGPHRNRLRTFSRLVSRIWKFAEKGGLNGLFDRDDKQNTKLSESDKGVDVAA